MTSEEKTAVPALLNYIRSDLFSFGNLSKNAQLIVPSTTAIVKNNTIIETDKTDPSLAWNSVISISIFATIILLHSQIF